jgi:hypothetical protein
VAAAFGRCSFKSCGMGFKLMMAFLRLLGEVEVEFEALYAEKTGERLKISI